MRRRLHTGYVASHDCSDETGKTPVVEKEGGGGDNECFFTTV